MKIAVIGTLSSHRSQLLIDKMIEDGHELVFVNDLEKDTTKEDLPSDYFWIDEYSEIEDTAWHAAPTTIKSKPYYRQKERY